MLKIADIFWKDFYRTKFTWKMVGLFQSIIVSQNVDFLVIIVINTFKKELVS